ncbi:YggT family protein [Ramlibacter sp.]|uniref:YggT family protein n=1 Tax=Ramlibacter sp. TaxID=1917967 RepID=UPI002D4F36E1|nr:YggT family protein [Ramlibacter sp.]HYD74795.1 YggT family protein [Ramlibacter sp.]
MGYQILSFLLDVATGLLGGACLLRLYMQRQRVPFGNPVGRFVFALTDWIVLPLRKVLPAVARWDTASVVAAYLVELVQYAILWSLFAGGTGFGVVFAMALYGLVRLVLSALTALVIVYAILSWVQSDSMLTDIVDRLCAPLLRPFRRVIPLVGGIDLSPLALLVLLQVLTMVLAAVFRPIL